MEDRWHRVAERQRRELLASAHQESVGADHQPAGTQLAQGGEGRLELALGACMQDVERKPERACRRLQVFCLNRGYRVARVEQQGDRARRRHELVDQLQPLLPGIDVERDHAGEVAARPIEARHESGFDRVDAAVKHDRNCLGRRVCRHRRSISPDRRDHGIRRR